MATQIEFEKDGLVARVVRASENVLKRMGAYVRAVARNKIKRSRYHSSAGTPPHTRRGLLRRAILFGVERKSLSVFIGPAERFIGTSMVAHEFGGTYKKERYPKRPLMGPSLQESAPQLAKMWAGAVN